MIALVIVFYMFLFVFGFAGSTRGWAKELLLIFGVILGLAVIVLIETLSALIGPFLTSNPTIQYWVRVSIILAMTFFGYQSPKLSRLVKATEKKDRIQDILLGIIMGVIAGYFVVGTLWSYSAQAGYPMFNKYIIPPNTPELAETTDNLLKILPPVWLAKAPLIYVVVVAISIFIIVVFV
jgi:hypothetical protein